MTVHRQPPFPIRRYLAPRHWPTWLAMGLLRALTLLPWGLQLALGRGLGALLHRVAGTRRRVAATNIALCYPQATPAEREALVRDHFRSLAISLFETGLSWWGSERRLRRLCRIEGLEHWQALKREGRGALLLYGHYTTLDLAGRFLALHIPELVPSYKPAHNRLFNEMMVRARRRCYGGLLEADDLRAMVRGLRAGQLVSYSPDQDFGAARSVFAPFMGVPAATLTTTARLARMTGAAIVPFYPERLPGGAGYRVRLGEPLPGYPSGDPQADAVAVNRSIEAHVESVPEQYLWVHKRFKTRPDGEANPYRRG